MGRWGTAPCRLLGSTLVSWFQKTAADHPDTVAVRDAIGRATLTFTESRRRLEPTRPSPRGARCAELGDRVGVFLDRSCDLVVTLLAIQRAGAAYVPVDPDYPSERVAFVTGRRRSVGRRAPGRRLRLGLGDHAVPIVDLDADRSSIEAVSADDPGIVIAPEDAAYVIYTSGSTGRPKGVVVPHRGVVNTLATMAERPGLDAGEVMVGPTTPAFDLSVPDLFLPLLTGATLVLASPDTARDPLALAATLDDVDADLHPGDPGYLADARRVGLGRTTPVCESCAGVRDTAPNSSPTCCRARGRRCGTSTARPKPRSGPSARAWRRPEARCRWVSPIAGMRCAIVDPRGHRRRSEWPASSGSPARDLPTATSTARS